MRRLLDGFYDLTGWLAAAALMAILLIVLAQVALNAADMLLGLFGAGPLGLLIPSYADFAGYFLVGATFFALASSFTHGAHIRVDLVIQGLPRPLRRVTEAVATGVATALAAYFTWYAAGLLHSSWRFGDLSPGLVAIPLWIPQGVMTAGAGALAVACLDAFVTVLSGRDPSYRAAEEGGMAPGR